MQSYKNKETGEIIQAFQWNTLETNDHIVSLEIPHDGKCPLCKREKPKNHGLLILNENSNVKIQCCLNSWIIIEPDLDGTNKYDFINDYMFNERYEEYN